MAGIGKKWLGMAENGWNGWIWQDMAGYGWNGWKGLEMASSYWKWLISAENAGNG